MARTQGGAAYFFLQLQFLDHHREAQHQGPETVGHINFIVKSRDKQMHV